MAEPLALRQDGAVATLVLDRPERRNAITLAMWQALPELLRRAAADPAVRALVVRSASAEFFSVGADIGEFERVFADPATARAYNDAVAAALDALAAWPRPTLARIEGLCIGGGCALALACDLRLAAYGSRLGITPSRLGLGYSLADTRRLVDTVGPARARDLLFTGRLLAAEEALAIGLIDRLAAPAELDATLAATLDVLCAGSPTAIRSAKAMIAAVLDGAVRDTPETRRLYDDCFAGPDLREGVRAFLEKRPPRFTGR